MCMKDCEGMKGRLYSVPGPDESGDAGKPGYDPVAAAADPRDMFSPQDLSTVAIVTFLRLVDSPRDCIAYLAASSLMDIANP